MTNIETVGLLGGTGIEGCGIALRLARAGIKVALGSRSRVRAEELARKLNQQVGNGLIQGLENEAVFRQCRLLFLTTPFDVAADFLRHHSSNFHDGHILIDVTVPLRFQKGPHLLDLPEGSGSQYLRRHLPDKVPMVATFKTVPAHLLADLETPLDCDELVCGDSADAKKEVLSLLQKIPEIRWLDGGPLRYCRALEAMTMLVIGINHRYKVKHGRFKVVGV